MDDYLRPPELLLLPDDLLLPPPIEPDDEDELLLGLLMVEDERDGVDMLRVGVVVRVGVVERVGARYVPLLLLRDGVEYIPVLLLGLALLVAGAELPLFTALLRVLCVGVELL